MSSDEASPELQLPPILFSGFAFLFEGNLNITSSDGKTHTNIKDWVSPVTTNPVKLSWPKRSSIISIQFWPGKFFEFFGWPQHLFFDDTVLLHETDLEKPFNDLFEQLFEKPSMEEKSGLLDTFLLQHYPQKRFFRPVISDTIEKLLNRHRKISLESLIEDSRYSQRHFRRLFQEAVGMNPNIFMRIIRFYKAFSYMKTDSFDSLTEISYKAGYFDQSHFIRDFKDFWGMSPGEVFSVQNNNALEILANAPGMGKSK